MKYLKPVLAIFLILVLFLSACSDDKKKSKDDNDNKDEITEPEKSEKSSGISKERNDEPSISITDIPIDTILGRWLRPDGNYVIQINSIDSKNQIDAQYFNPRPIKIARAELIPGDNYRIFIEFDDEGYKGSSYDLIYDPAQDALSGKYFQASYGQTYQIGFVRLKE